MRVAACRAPGTGAFWLAYASVFFGLGLILGLAPPTARMLVAGLVVTGAAIVLTSALMRTEGRSLADAGASWEKGSITRFLVGLAFGGMMVVAVTACSWITIGPLTFVRSPGVDVPVLALMTATFVALSPGEELGFRGYPFHRLRDRYGALTAQLVVALAFAVYHVLQGCPLVNAFVGTTAGSELFGMAVLASRGLAFPIGVHAAGNLESWIVGMKGEAGFWRMEVGRQPSFLESALLYLGVMILAALVLWWWMRQPAWVGPGVDQQR